MRHGGMSESGDSEVAARKAPCPVPPGVRLYLGPAASPGQPQPEQQGQPQPGARPSGGPSTVTAPVAGPTAKIFIFAPSRFGSYIAFCLSQIWQMSEPGTIPPAVIPEVKVRRTGTQWEWCSSSSGLNGILNRPARRAPGPVLVLVPFSPGLEPNLKGFVSVFHQKGSRLCDS